MAVNNGIAVDGNMVADPIEKMADKLLDTEKMLEEINTKVNQLSMYLRGCNTDEVNTREAHCVSESIDINRGLSQKILSDITEICERI